MVALRRNALERSIVSNRSGSTSTFISACIKDNGDFVLEGQDIGRAPMEFYGDSDYEYALTVPAEHKPALLAALAEAARVTLRPPKTGEESDELLLELTARLYSGVNTAVSDLRKLLQAKEIPFRFFTF